MKKQAKKLTLSRETLVGLDHHLARVAGGATAAAACGTYSGLCENSNGIRTCNTCNNNTCNTNYC
jgi:hypothetical protein